MTRYRPSRLYLAAGLLLLPLAAGVAWFGAGAAPGVFAATVLLAAAVILGLLSFRPAIEIHPHHLRLGGRVVPWQDIRSVEWTGWVVPMVVVLSTEDNRKVVVVYPGGLNSARALLQHIRRASRDALIDGVPYREYWNAAVPDPAPSRTHARPDQSVPSLNRYPLLRREDEAEVERLYQRLKVVGHLDSKGNDEP